MDVLETLITPPKIKKPEEEGRGRPLELKSFIIENNGQLDSSFAIDGWVGEIRDTGLEKMKILSLLRAKSESSIVPSPESDMAQFYLDMSDKRFLLLHTNFESELVTAAVKTLVGSSRFELDSAWLPTNMLNDISSNPGNKREGYKIGYVDHFSISDPDDLVSENDMVVEAKGGISKHLYDVAGQDPVLKRTLGYESVSISRGNTRLGVLEDLGYNGRFSLRKGRSVGDHMVLVGLTKEDYKGRVAEVEDRRLDAYKVNGNSTVRGVPFEFRFSRPIEDWRPILSRVFDSKDPFRIWGLTSKVRDGYYRVLGVDMHTGHPLDIEITDHLFRVYLPKNSCGNVIMRLFANLQRYFDATMTCNQLSVKPIAS